MDIKYLLKNAKLVRTMAKPYMDLKRKMAHEKYLKSEDHSEIQKYKDKFAGKRCFIIGNGPSLRSADLENLTCEITFAANRIYEIFDKTSWRPTFYLAVDNDFISHNIEKLNKFHAKQKFLVLDKRSSGLYNKDGEIIRIFEYADFKINKWNDLTSHISEDVSNYFSVGYTVTFTAMQLAIYMGFKTLILLGVDFNYSIVRDANGKIHENKDVQDYFSGKRYSSTVLNYNSVLHSYNVAKQYADAHGIQIFNATRGGKLEVFNRIDFDKLIGGGTS